MSKLMVESTSIPVATGKPGRWSATLLTVGVGSSGNWLEETVRRDGPSALKKGAKCFVTHNRLENGEPDPFRMWATLAEDARYEHGVGLVAEIEVLPSWRDRVEEVAPHTSLSVYLMGESDMDGNIVAILDDVQNGVDLVVYPGRPGSGLVEKLYESASSGSNKASTASVEDTPDTEGLSPMAEKDVLEAISKLTVAVEAMTESKHQEAKAEADNAAAMVDASKQVEAFAAALEAISQADLLPTQVESLKTRAKAGEDVTAAIEEAKAIAVEARTAVQESLDTHDESGRFTEGAGTTYTLRSVGGSK